MENSPYKLEIFSENSGVRALVERVGNEQELKIFFERSGLPINNQTQYRFLEIGKRFTINSEQYEIENIRIGYLDFDLTNLGESGFQFIVYLQVKPSSL